MKDIYTPAESAVDILNRRRQDPILREKVANYLGNKLPSQCLELDNPVAILARYVPRATGEDRIFADTALANGFMPYWASYKADRFTNRNPEKVETIRPPINWQKGQKTRSWVVEPEKRQGGVGQLETVYGNSSSEYQQSIREMVFTKDGLAEHLKSEFDMAEWYKYQAPRFGYTTGNLAPFYYPATMALATIYCALFEDFDVGPNAKNGDLASFTNGVVYPAINKVESELGLSPVIVKLPFQASMNLTDLSFLDLDQAEHFRKFGHFTT